jgi:alkylation response protein AidB-like acyl-CoA dehydrogenase
MTAQGDLRADRTDAPAQPWSDDGHHIIRTPGAARTPTRWETRVGDTALHCHLSRNYSRLAALTNGITVRYWSCAACSQRVDGSTVIFPLVVN